MAKVSTYLAFTSSTEEAFNLYRSVFGGEFTQVQRMGDMPAQPGQPPLPDAVKKQILHIALPITGGHMLLGSDAPEPFAPKITQGNNVSINLEPDSRAEADRLFKGLSVGGKVNTPMQEMFWGAYWGSFIDRFGVQWMINCTAN